MSESKDRAALRRVKTQLLTWNGNEAWHRNDADAIEVAEAALAQPDPAEQLAEALKCVLAAWQIGADYNYSHLVDKARAALAAYEASK